MGFHVAPPLARAKNSFNLIKSIAQTYIRCNKMYLECLASAFNGRLNQWIMSPTGRYL